MPESTSRNGRAHVAFGEVVLLSRERLSDPEGSGLERYVGLEHIEPGDLKIRRWGDIADGTTFTNVFRAGQVLFGKRRAYQRKVAVADFGGVCSGDIYVLEPKGKHLLPDLLPFICQTDKFFEHAIGTSAGSLSPRTNWESMASYQLALPSLEEQRRIADALNAAVALHESVRCLLDRSAAVHQANLADLQSSPGFSRLPLGELLNGIVAGKSVAGAPSRPSSTECGVLKVSAVDPYGFRSHESKRLLDPTDFVPELSIRAGDLLITRANTPDLVGEVCIADRDYPNLMLSDKTLRLEPRAGVDAHLLWEVLQSESVRSQLRASATGTGRAMKNISQPKIRELTVAYPNDSHHVARARTRLLASREGVQVIQARLFECRLLMRSLIERAMRRAEQ